MRNVWVANSKISHCWKIRCCFRVRNSRKVSSRRAVYLFATRRCKVKYENAGRTAVFLRSRWRDANTISTDFLPNSAALKTLNELIACGVSLGKISDKYNVIGHRQTRPTECPGESFYKYVVGLPRWTANPIPIFTNSTTTTTEATGTRSNNVEENGEPVASWCLSQDKSNLCQTPLSSMKWRFDRRSRTRKYYIDETWHLLLLQGIALFFYSFPLFLNKL